MKADITRIIKAAVLFTVLTAFDLFTKSIAVNALEGGKRVPLIPGARSDLCISQDTGRKEIPSSETCSDLYCCRGGRKSV